VLRGARKGTDAESKIASGSVVPVARGTRARGDDPRVAGVRDGRFGLMGHPCGWCGKLVIGWYDEAVVWTNEGMVFLHHGPYDTMPTCYMRYIASKIEAR